MGPEPLDRSDPLPRPVGPEDWRDRVQAWRDAVADHLDGGRLGRTLVSVAFVCAGAAAIWWMASPPDDGPPIEDSLPMLDLGAVTTGVPTPSAPPVVVVHVAGAVVTPGLIKVEADARVADAIAAAGGATVDAELDRINLAAPVVDGQQIYVPVQGEVPPATVGSGPGVAEVIGPLDINIATVDQLDALPGVGPATAANIVSHRDLNGPFQSVSELEDVPGIGPAKLAQLRELVTVGRTP